MLFLATLWLTTQRRRLGLHSDAFRDKLASQLAAWDEAEAKLAGVTDELTEEEALTKSLSERFLEDEKDVLILSPAVAAREAREAIEAARNDGYKSVLVDIIIPQLTPFDDEFDELDVLAFIEELGAPVTSDVLGTYVPRISEAKGNVTIFAPKELMPCRRLMQNGATTVVNHRFDPNYTPIEFFRAQWAYVLRPLADKNSDFQCCVVRKYPRPFQLHVKNKDGFQKIREWSRYPDNVDIELACQKALTDIERGEL